jgi:hypothetical protein
MDTVVQEEGLYVYNMHNIAGKHLKSALHAKPGRVASYNAINISFYWLIKC